MAVTAAQMQKKRTGKRRKIPVAASTTIYAGTLVFVNSSGYGVGIVNSGGNKFFGIATATVDNSSGSAGDLFVECDCDGSYELVGAGFAQSDVGKPAYASDNFTLTPTAGAVSRVGIVEEYYSATSVLVRLGEPVAPAALVAAITGGEAPTEAEFNGLLTSLKGAGLMTSS